MKPKISIIVPIYNSSKDLSKCLDSIYNQTYSNIELILINDGSTDNCKEIIDNFSIGKKNVITVHCSNNGVSSARNLGLKLSTGQYIGFVDSDDFIDKDMFSLMSKDIIDDNSIDLSISYMFHSKKLFGKSIKNINIDQNRLLSLILCNNDIGGFVCNKLFKRDIIINNNIFFDEELSVCEDLDFCIKYAKYVNKANLVNKNFYYYWQRNTTTDAFNIKRLSVIKSYEKIIKYAKTNFNNNNLYFNLKKRLLMHEIWIWNSLRKSDDKNKLIIEKDILIKIKSNNLLLAFSSLIPWKYKILFFYLKLFKSKR